MLFLHVIVYSCNVVVFLLSNRIDKKFISFLYCNSTVLYILFHLSQPMTVYEPYQITKTVHERVHN